MTKIEKCDEMANEKKSSLKGLKKLEERLNNG